MFIGVKHRKGSAAGFMLLVFAIVIYLFLPLAKAAYEQIYFSHIRQRAISMLDSAAFSSAVEISPDAFSEHKIVLNTEEVKQYLVDTQSVISPDEVWVSQRDDGVLMGFSFTVPRVFSKKEVSMYVEGQYDFEMLSSPAY